DELPHLRVYTMAISEDEQKEIVFLHRVTPGSLGRSYGVHVAKLAGMPPSIVQRAEEVLKQLELGNVVAPFTGARPVPDAISTQNGHELILYGDDKLMVADGNGRYGKYEWQSEDARLAAQRLESTDGVEPDLDMVDVCAITPLDALNLLFVIQKRRSRLRK